MYFNDFNSFGNGRQLKATTMNVKNFIAEYLNLYPTDIDFVELSEKPQVWKHSCKVTGVIVLQPVTLVFEDGTPFEFATCPCLFQHYSTEIEERNKCRKVLFYIDR